VKKTINRFKRGKELTFVASFLLILLLLSISPAAASVTDWKFSPQNLVSGDALKIKGSASPGENIDLFVNFEKVVPVSEGKFEYVLNDVNIPEGFNNNFKVEAVGAQNLNVRVKMLLWLTKSSEASGNSAVVSQSSVPPGTYKIKIEGDAAEGVSEVNLKITAFQGIKADSKGNFKYCYETKSIPPGNFEVNVGGIKKCISILPVECPAPANSMSINFTDKVVYILNHTSDLSEGNWIEMESPSEGRNIQLPQPMTITYSGPGFEEYGGVSWNLSSEDNVNYTLNYSSLSPRTTFPVYLPGENVNLSFFGNSSLKGNADIYVLNVTSKAVHGIVEAFNSGNISDLESLSNKTVGQDYKNFSAVLGENGDLLDYNLGSFGPGQYCIVMVQENEDDSLTVLSSSAFVVSEYEMNVLAPVSIVKGENLDLDLELEGAPENNNCTYGAVLISEEAYRANVEINSNGATNNTSVTINGVSIIDEFGINSSNYDSKLTKSEIQKEIQTLIGEGNGSIAIGEIGQNSLSLTASELPEGHYYLFAGAYGPNREIAGLTQLEIYISPALDQEQPETVLPVANFSTNVTSGYAPLTAQFTDLSENSIGWNWDFGDGNTSTEQSPAHTYSSAGTYTVNLTVSNQNGTASKSVIITVPEIPGPYAYITNYYNSSVSVIDTATNTVVNTVNVGISPFGVAVSPDGSMVYVTNAGSNTVSVIDTATNIVIATVDVGKRPFGVAVNQDGTKVYVTNELSNTVSVIDTATNTVVATVDAGSYPAGIAVSPDGTIVYAVNEEGSLSVIDAATNTVTATVGLEINPIAVAVSPDGAKVYVTNWGSNTVSVIDAATNTVTATVSVGSCPGGIAISPDATKVYVTNELSNTVSVIDAETNTVTATVDAGNSLWGIAINPDGTRIYVANEKDNTVSVIDTATNTVTATVNVGSGPIAVGKFVGPGQAPVPSCNTSTIYGYNFNDSNKNKKMNGKEAGLSDATISLNGYDTCRGKLVKTTTKTDSAGYYEFKDVNPGIYVVSKSFVIGWLPTTKAAYTLTVPSDSTSIRKDFGNTQFVKKQK